jgi:hypothetical protein
MRLLLVLATFFYTTIMEQTAQNLKRTAHIAGALFLGTAITTIFSVLYVRSDLIVFKDAIATAQNITANEFLFRAGIAANMLCQVLQLFLGLALYRLFQGVNKPLAMLMLFSKTVSLTIAMVFIVGNIGALMVLKQGNAEYLKVFTPEQLQALMMLFLRVTNDGQGLLEIFWCPANFALGLLMLQSGFIPRVLGYLLIVGSCGFPINVALHLLVPSLNSPYLFGTIVFLGGIGGIPTIFWLLVVGIKPRTPDAVLSSHA